MLERWSHSSIWSWLSHLRGVRNARSKSGFLVAACEKARRLGSKFCLEVTFVRLRKSMSCESPTHMRNNDKFRSKVCDAPGKALWMLVVLEPWIRTRQPSVPNRLEGCKAVCCDIVCFSKKRPSWLLVPGVPSHHCQAQERVGWSRSCLSVKNSQVGTEQVAWIIYCVRKENRRDTLTWIHK